MSRQILVGFLFWSSLGRRSNNSKTHLGWIFLNHTKRCDGHRKGPPFSFYDIVQTRVVPDSRINLKSENPIKKTGAERTSDFYFLKFYRIGADSGLLFSFNLSERSGVRIFVFVIFIGAERSSDFYFGLNLRSGADFGFFCFHNLSERSGVRSRETCRSIADSDKIGFSDLSENLLSDKTD